MRRLFGTRTHTVAWAGALVSLVGVLLLAARRLESSGWIAGATSRDFAFVSGDRPGQLVAGAVLALVGGIVAAVCTVRLARTGTLRVLLAGIVLLVAGVVLLLAAPNPSFGWFAYAPLADEAVLPITHTWQERVGQVVVLVGAVVTAFAVGRLSTQRRH
ncbi:hypothetical protein [Curtobacterium sp. TXMA1]|uniref:hypothetical protein n=1 Tax=Curtobacterium sp. TXMA1 TaxID=2876939 RepID=UPI001CC9507F|nr:hypothetical protein [Curtobacterium sp. TXMA1]UBQ02853.1 hypothetical protein LCG91_01395 [Curtobacterium sp. TXMA1]